MRILIDLQGAQSLTSRDRGIGRYSMALAKAIVRNRRNHDVFILLNGLLSDSIEKIRKEFSSILPSGCIAIFYAPSPVSASNPENAWRREAAELIREALIDDISPDVLLLTSLFEGAKDNCITSIGRIQTATKVVSIVHDLIPYINPELYLDSYKAMAWYYSKIDDLRKADLILSVSESAQREILDYLGFEKQSVIPIFAGSDMHFCRIDGIPDLNWLTLRKYKIFRPYVMTVGALEPRKNLERLLRSFSLLPKVVRQAHQLVLVGESSRDAQMHLFRVAGNAGLAPDDLVLTGYVSEEELVALYSLCTVFIFPSVHEGFGLPVIEAMCCGAAAIASDSTSLAEVIGWNDALFDPESDQSIACLMHRALTDPRYSEALRVRSVLQSEKFSWDKTANLALRAMERVSESPAPRAVIGRVAELSDQIAAIRTKIDPSQQDWDLVERSILHNESIPCQMEAGIIERERKVRLDSILECLRFAVVGHVNGSYSLASVNRRLALSLDSMKPGTVRIEQVEGKPAHDLTDVPPDERSAIAALTALAGSEDGIAVTICQHWPVWVPSARGDLRLANVAWEESLVPCDMVRLLNREFDGVVVSTRFIAKSLIDSGVYLPVRVIGHAPKLNKFLSVGAKRAAAPSRRKPTMVKPFTFLHVSSCFPRKGVDALLAAYVTAFRRSDPVRLLIKSFPNPHNDVAEQIIRLQNSDPEAPEMVLINRDISEGELAGLYAMADAAVLPTRGEGFNIPAAEALAAGVPLIVTGYSGQTDFATSEVARQINFRFAASHSHVSPPGSVWAEPNLHDLVAAMREAYDAARDPALRGGVAIRVDKGRRVATALGDGTAWAARIREIVAQFLLDGFQAKRSASKIAWVTTWEIRCGIATHSRYLLDRFPDAVQNVIVLCDEQTPVSHLKKPNLPEARIAWRQADHGACAPLAHAIAATDAKVAVIQHHPGFFDATGLAILLRDPNLTFREIIVILHNVEELLESESWPYLANALTRVSRTLVHSIKDLNLLKSAGISENVVLFPHGALRPTMKCRPARNIPRSAAPLLGTYGFFLPHKGFDILLEAFARVRGEWANSRMRMVTAKYPSKTSHAEIDRCQRLAGSLGLEDAIEWQTDFLSDEASLALLSDCDLLVVPHQHTKESASGSARVAMASRVPVLVTPLAIFQELENAVIRAEGFGAVSLATAITAALEDRELRQATTDRADQWLIAHDWTQMSERLHGMINGIVANRDSGMPNVGFA